MTPGVVEDPRQSATWAALQRHLQAVVAAVGIRHELRHVAEPRIGRRQVRIGRETAVANGLKAIDVHLIGEMVAMRADILRAKRHSGGQLAFDAGAPLQVIGNGEPTRRERGDRNRWQAGARTRERRGARQRTASETGEERLIRGGGGIDRAVRYAGRDRQPARRSQEAPLKRVHKRWVRGERVDETAGRQQIAKDAESGAQQRARPHLPRDAGARLPDRAGPRVEHVRLIRRHDGADRLIDIVRDPIERRIHTGQRGRRARRIRDPGCPQTDRPRGAVRQFDRVLSEHIDVADPERRDRGGREGARRRRGYAVDELRQRCVGHERRRARAEVIVVEPEPSNTLAQSPLVPSRGPRHIVVHMEPGDFAALRPEVVEPAQGGKGHVRPLALEHDWQRA